MKVRRLVAIKIKRVPVWRDDKTFHSVAPQTCSAIASTAMLM